MGKQYSRYGPTRKNSSGSDSGTVKVGDVSSKRLLSVKMNGYGKYDTELSTRRSLLRDDSYKNGMKSKDNSVVL